MLGRIAALLVVSVAASAEPIGWAIPFDEPLEDFELCSDAGPECPPLAFFRWHEPASPFGDVWLHVADVELVPGNRYWVRGNSDAGPIEPVNPVRIWCSPWDFTGDGYIGLFDYLRWMIGGFEGGSEAQTNLNRVAWKRCG